MNIDEHLRAVQLNQIECGGQVDRARAAWAALKSKSKEAATPWRIVAVGAISGFLVGRSSTVDAASASVGAKLFSTVGEALVSALGASVAAGAAAVDAESAVHEEA